MGSQHLRIYKGMAVFDVLTSSLGKVSMVFPRDVNIVRDPKFVYIYIFCVSAGGGQDNALTGIL